MALVVCITATSFTSGLASRLSCIPGIIDISDITHPFEHDKSKSISQWINGKSRNLQKLLKYCNGTTTSVSNVLLSYDVFPIIFLLYSKDLLFIILLLFILSPLLISVAESFISWP